MRVYRTSWKETNQNASEHSIISKGQRWEGGSYILEELEGKATVLSLQDRHFDSPYLHEAFDTLHEDILDASMWSDTKLEVIQIQPFFQGWYRVIIQDTTQWNQIQWSDHPNSMQCAEEIFIKKGIQLPLILQKTTLDPLPTLRHDVQAGSLGRPQFIASGKK